MPNTKGRTRAQDTDRYVGLRMRERRIMLGLTQYQMSELIGVTYQQAHKYEKGINRIASGRLYRIAKALGTDVNYFFEGADDQGPVAALGSGRQFLLMAQQYQELRKTEQEAVCDLVSRLHAANPAEKDVRRVPRLVG